MRHSSYTLLRLANVFSRDPHGHSEAIKHDPSGQGILVVILKGWRIDDQSQHMTCEVFEYSSVMCQNEYILDEFLCQFDMMNPSLAGTAAVMRFENHPEGTDLEDSNLISRGILGGMGRL